jgi:hypothetical protein
MLGLTPGSDTNYPDSFYVIIFSPSKHRQRLYRKLGHEHFLPHIFQFIIHYNPFIWHYTAWILTVSSYKPQKKLT